MAFADPYYLHIFNCLPEFGPVRLNRLAKHFPDFATAYSAKPGDFLEAGIERPIVDAWFKAKPRLDMERSIAWLKNAGLELLTYGDCRYPKALKEISQAPPLLYYRGALGEPDELCVGVVGTRKISTYGQSAALAIVEPLATAGITIVSGLAYGVDAAAHRAALKQGGRTIAVLGCGLDDKTIYPRDHVALAHDIINSGGLIISEYPPERPALAQNFVARNRIISGLSLGLVVIECGLKSGALITAKYAFDQNRSVYAVPGSIYSPVSAGPNNLLTTDKARAVTGGADILRDLGVPVNLAAAPPESISLTVSEQTVLSQIGNEPVLADDILERTGLAPSLAAGVLTFLEIKGKIRDVGGQHYIRVK